MTGPGARWLFTIFMALALLCCAGSEAFSQTAAAQNNQFVPADSGNVQILTTKDGSSFIGRILKTEAGKVFFVTEFDTLKIPVSRVQRVRVASAVGKSGQAWFPNPNATRLFFAPGGRMLKKGQGYFSDYYLFFPGVAYGVTDRITIGGGISLVPTVRLDNQLIYFTPKLGLVSSENLNIAAGVLLVSFLSSFDASAGGAGILYGVATFGGPSASLTTGLGYGFTSQELADKPMVIIGFERRLSRRIALVSENWIFPGIDQPLASLGVRFMGEALSVDLAMVTVLGEDFFFPGLPFVDFVFNFR